VNARQWQLIETAPRDGQRILVFANGHQFVAKWCAYLLTEGGFWAIPIPDDEIAADNSWDHYVIRLVPTHWTLLLEPPQ
jgi:hypothetical protein